MTRTMFILLLIISVNSNALPTFYGTYQSYSTRSEPVTILVLKENFVRLDGYCKKTTYEILEHDDLHILVKPLESDECKVGTINISLSSGAYQVSTTGFSSRFGLVDDAYGEDQVDIFLHSKDAKMRSKALHIINLLGASDSDKYNEIGLKDESPEVRSLAVWFLPGNLPHTIPLIITAMAHDPDEKVRASAANSLDSLYTDNGVDSCKDIDPVASSLNEFSIALKNPETENQVINILGLRYNGGTFLPCCMSDDKRNQILEILKQREMESSDIATKIQDSIKNISNCPR